MTDYNWIFFDFQCDAEVNFLEGQIGLPPISSSSSTSNSNSRSYVQPGSQLEMVLAEARRLEEAAHRNEDELRQLVLEQRGNQTPSENLLESSEDPNLRAEIMQLKHRLAGTDQELQKTNLTLRYTTTHYSESPYFVPIFHLDGK